MPDVLRPPPEIIATFPKPNYVNPETHGPGLMVCTTLLSVIAIVVVGLRLYSRLYIIKAPGWDDFCIVLALIFGIAMSVLIMLGNQMYYNGYHVWDIPSGSSVPHRINIWTAQLCFTLALSSVKVSVLLFYKRLSASWSRKFLIAVWAGIAYNILYCIGFVITLCTLYRPLAAYWLSFDPVYYAEGNFEHGSEQLAEPLSAYFSLFGDLYSTVLPLIMVSRLSLPPRQKWILYTLFSLGFAVVIFGSVRAYYMYRVVNVDWDFTWTLWKLWLIGVFELWFAVFAASAPALKPFFGNYFDKWTSSRGDTANRKHMYVVRSDGHGNLGKVERRSIRDNGRYAELSNSRSTNERGHGKSASSSHIVKSVEYDVERCGPDPDWNPHAPFARTGSIIALSRIDRTPTAAPRR